MRCAHSCGRFCQLFDFASRPLAKRVPQRVIAASKILSLAADQALGAQVVVAAVELVQLELERPGVVRASDNAVLPKLLHDLMRLFN